MPSADLTSIFKDILSGIIGLFFGGIIGGFITYRFERKRDDLKWEREKQQLKMQWEHEKELKLKELEIQYQAEKSNEIRKQLMMGVDRPIESIAEARRLSSLRLPIKQETRGGWASTVEQGQRNLGYVEIFQVNINEKRYDVSSLGLPIEEQIIDESHNYAIVKVVGESMNLAGIDNGDYVLFRFQNVAKNGDIVIAEIESVDRMATIKRLVIHNNSVVLKPESTNPMLEYRVSNSAEQKAFYIRGVAIVAFKPERS